MTGKLVYGLLIVFGITAGAFAADRDIDVLRKHVAQMESRLARLEKTVADLNAENAALRAKAAPAPKPTQTAVLPRATKPAATTIGTSGLLTDNELQQVEALIAQWDAELAKDNWSQHEIRNRRRPARIVREYEKYKYDAAARRWKEQPVFAADPKDCVLQRFYPPVAHRSYQGQFYCGLCRKADGCDGWVDAAGSRCLGTHGPSVDDRWRFLINYCKEREKAIGAKAHLWNAKQHGDITENAWIGFMSENF